MLVISSHRLETVIAHGVTSEVWSAVRLGPGGFAQTVALKTLTPLHAASPPYVRAFLNEARAASHVRHPHVVQAHALLEEEGRYWLSMELVRGWTLRSLIATLKLTRRTIPLEVAVSLVRDAAAGAHAIHEAGLLHRNITPDNVMASAAGHAVVLDFGCAAWQLAEKVRFTPPLTELDPSYASPQLVSRQRLDARTDVYSLGAVLHELITGEPPPPRKPGGGQILVSPSSWRPDLPAVLEDILDRALEGEPHARFASALDLERALEVAAIQHRWHVTPSQVSSYLTEVFGGTLERGGSDRADRRNERDVTTTRRPAVRAAKPTPAPVPAPSRTSSTPSRTSSTPSRTSSTPSRSTPRAAAPAVAAPRPTAQRPASPHPASPRPAAQRPPSPRPDTYALADLPTDPFVKQAPPLPRPPGPPPTPRNARGSDAPPVRPAASPAPRPAPPTRQPPPPFRPAAPPVVAPRHAPPALPVARPIGKPPTPAELANGSGARRMRSDDLAPRRQPPRVPDDDLAGPGVRTGTFLGKTRLRLRRR